MGTVKYNSEIFRALSLIYEAEKNKPLHKIVVKENKEEKIIKAVEMSTKEYLLLKTGLADRTINEKIQYLQEKELITLESSYKVKKSIKLIYRLTEAGKLWIKANKPLDNK
jgi:hypothetical protein